MFYACCHVDDSFRCPDEGEVKSYTDDAARRIEERLQLHLPKNLDEPAKQFPSAIFALFFQPFNYYLSTFRLSHHPSLTSVPHINFSLRVLKKLWQERFSTLML